MQAAHWLLAGGWTRAEALRLARRGDHLLRPPEATLVDLLAAGEAFRTSGCPDCNRPYYNERPGGPLYNYPRPLTASEARRELAALLATLRTP